MIAMSLEDAFDVIKDVFEIAKRDDFAISDLDTISMNCCPWTDFGICCITSQGNDNKHENSFRNFASNGQYQMAAKELFEIGNTSIIKNLINEYKNKPRLLDIMYGLKIMMENASTQKDIHLSGRIKKFAKDNFPKVIYQIIFSQDCQFKVTNNHNPINGQKSFMFFGKDRGIGGLGYHQKYVTCQGPGTGIIEQFLKIKLNKSRKYISFTIENEEGYLLREDEINMGIYKRHVAYASKINATSETLWEITLIDDDNINISPVKYPKKLLYIRDKATEFKDKLCLSEKSKVEKDRCEWRLEKSKVPTPTFP